MLGELTPTEIESLLHDQVIGRVGCWDSNNVFVVPITYAYDGNYIYGHSREGMKIKMMRNNPSVCFEVDVVHNMTNWKSVILWGEYEELTELNERQVAMETFADRMKPLIISETISPMMRQPEPHPVDAILKPIVFRIKVNRKMGRYERA